MAASVIGSRFFSFSGSDPAAVTDVNIPAATTAVYAFWALWGSGGLTVSTIQLDNNNADESETLAVSGNVPGTGVHVWYNPTTGVNREIDVAWTGNPSEGPVFWLVYVKDGDTTAWREALSDGCGYTSCSADFDITTTTTDLVLGMDEKYDDSSAPGNQSGWTSVDEDKNGNRRGRVRYIAGGASSINMETQDGQYSSIVAVSIKEESAGAGSAPPTSSLALLGVGI